MLKFLRIPEALQVLKKETNREWTASEVLDVAKQRNIKLHAAAPAMARVEALNIAPGEGFGERHSLGASYAPLAWLYPNDIGQLLISDEALTSQPYITSPIVGERYRYTEPVRVTVDTVRIQSERLGQIIAIWREAQGGPWVEVDDKDEPSGKRMARIWGPDWMFPESKPVDSSDLKPAKKKTIAQIRKEDQEKWILKWLLANGYKPMELPDRGTDPKGSLKSNAKSDSDEAVDSTGKNLFKTWEFNAAWQRLSGGKVVGKNDGSRHEKRISYLSNQEDSASTGVYRNKLV